jgi:hypothetical protein
MHQHLQVLEHPAQLQPVDWCCARTSCAHTYVTILETLLHKRLTAALLLCCTCMPYCSLLCRDSPEPWLADSRFFAPCQTLAKARMMAALLPCDLELMQQSSHHAQMLLTLPFGVLRELLASHETRVAAESTVVALINLWLAAQRTPATAEQKFELACCLRLRGMPAYYLEQVRGRCGAQGRCSSTGRQRCLAG